MADDKVHELSGDAVDTLIALVERGPLEDSNIPSISGRDELVALGLVSKIVVKGWGRFEAVIQTATYEGVSQYCHRYGGNTIDEAKHNRMTKHLLIKADAV